MKKIISGVAVTFFLLLVVLFVRTSKFTVEHIKVPPCTERSLNRDMVSQRLAVALRFKTISHQTLEKSQTEQFRLFHGYLETAFPRLHKSLTKEIINDYGLLYTWEGTEKDLKPVLLLAHQDVVPANSETEDDWTHPPFGGVIADGYIWGRGALDMKCTLTGILEAIESSLIDGFQPRRTILLGFGHDEEIGGEKGACEIALLLKERNIQPAFVLDEGGIIASGLIPGATLPVALIGIAEKGYMSLELTVKGTGGHSSMPPKHTAVGVLSKAITDIENNPFPENFKYTSEFFNQVGPGLPFFQRLIFANLWLFEPLIKPVLTASPEMNAAIRTTFAATMFTSGIKENVLPTNARAIINVRILPGDDISDIITHMSKSIDNPGVKIKQVGNADMPTPVSNSESKSYQFIKQTIHQVYAADNVIVSPYIVTACTDSRHYSILTENVYRFQPVVYHPGDPQRIHGINERIAVENYMNAVRFYYQLIQNSSDI